MRRTDRETTREEAWRIFDQSAYSVLSMSYRNRPYATALSVARIDETLYFHCARDGEKIRAMRENPNVCLHSVARMENCAEGFTVYYASCTIRGTASRAACPLQDLYTTEHGHGRAGNPRFKERYCCVEHHRAGNYGKAECGKMTNVIKNK